MKQSLRKAVALNQQKKVFHFASSNNLVRQRVVRSNFKSIRDFSMTLFKQSTLNTIKLDPHTQIFKILKVLKVKIVKSDASQRHDQNIKK